MENKISPLETGLNVSFYWLLLWEVSYYQCALFMKHKHDEFLCSKLSHSIQWGDLWKNELFYKNVYMFYTEIVLLVLNEYCPIFPDDILHSKKSMKLFFVLFLNLLSVMLKQHSLEFHNFCVVGPVLVRLVCEDTCSSRVNGISFIEIDSCMCMCTLLVLLWTGGCCHAIWVPCSARWADIQQPVRRHWQIRDWTGPQGVSVHRSAIIALRKPIHQLQTRDLIKQ